MKALLLLLATFGLLVACGRPEAGPSGKQATETFNPPKDSTNVVILFASTGHGTPYKFEVPKAVIEKLPEWSPTSDTIPLAPQRAAQLAFARYKSLSRTSTSQLEASQILLQTISRFRSKWAYNISFDSPEGEQSSPEPNDLPRTMVVLLDGTVVDPVIVTDPSQLPQIHL